MKPLPIAIVAALAAALLWWFWPRDKPATTAAADAAKAAVAAAPTPAPVAATPPPAPPPPKVEPPLVATVYFDFDRSALLAGDTPKLDELVAKLKDRNYSVVTVTGYADRIGEAPHNDALSRKRADAAVAYLVAKGVDATRSKSEGKGESDAVSGDACRNLGAESGKNKALVDCLQKDRRVEVAVVN